MVDGFRDYFREDSFNEDKLVGLWNKYLDHVFSNEQEISNIADLTSIHQYILELIKFRFHELNKSFSLYIKIFTTRIGFDDQDHIDTLLDRISRPQYDYLVSELINVNKQDLDKESDIYLMNEFISHVLFKREINSFIDEDDTLKFSELNGILSFSDLAEKFNLYIQERNHSNLIVELIDLYFRGLLSKSTNWDNLDQDSKERIRGVTKLGRPPFDAFNQEKVNKHIKTFLESPEKDKSKYWKGKNNKNIVQKTLALHIIYECFKVTEKDVSIDTIKARIKNNDSMKPYLNNKI